MLWSILLWFSWLRKKSDACANRVAPLSITLEHGLVWWTVCILLWQVSDKTEGDGMHACMSMLLATRYQHCLASFFYLKKVVFCLASTTCVYAKTCTGILSPWQSVNARRRIQPTTTHVYIAHKPCDILLKNNSEKAAETDRERVFSRDETERSSVDGDGRRCV